MKKTFPAVILLALVPPHRQPELPGAPASTRTAASARATGQARAVLGVGGLLAALALLALAFPGSGGAVSGHGAAGASLGLLTPGTLIASAAWTPCAAGW